MKQFDLTFAFDESSLTRWLEKETGRKVELTLTDNSTRMLSVRQSSGVASVRLHRVFLEAPTEVLCEVASFIKKRKVRTPLISGFIKDKSPSIRKGRTRRVATNTLGACHDLLAVFDSLNAEYFGGKVEARITWGCAPARKTARRRTLGSYSYTSGIIRINPVLDDKKVPGYFLSYVVYHEMLHASLGVGIKDGRRLIHTAEFRERERLFSDYTRATAWEKTNRV